MSPPPAPRPPAVTPSPSLHPHSVLSAESHMLLAWPSWIPRRCPLSPLSSWQPPPPQVCVGVHPDMRGPRHLRENFCVCKTKKREGTRFSQEHVYICLNFTAAEIFMSFRCVRWAGPDHRSSSGPVDGVCDPPAPTELATPHSTDTDICPKPSLNAVT